ncbi:MAG: ferritin family protein [Candidatus Cloacimonadales bacterium]|nr:ferritin family protein [Candidatus Cloacimonadales bacterium]
MNFFERAKEMEEQTRNFYLELADKCAADEGLKYILKKLVMDHEQHGEKFQQMADDNCTELQSTEAFESTIKYFQNLQQKHETFSCDINQVKMYRQALVLLEKKITFYIQGKSEIECEKNQAVLAEIIEEENQHKFVLENIIEIVSRPQTWIENAEFTHIKNY